MHGTPLGRLCPECGVGLVVGGDGPDWIEKGQIWVTRGWPGTKHLIESVNAEEKTVIIEEEYEGGYKGSMSISDLYEEYWYWGVAT